MLNSLTNESTYAEHYLCMRSQAGELLQLNTEDIEKEENFSIKRQRDLKIDLCGFL
jgi:hypothetical protein